MKFFISDLHLGDGSRADDFHYTDEFLKFLEFAKHNCEELIIVGDLFELWQCDLDKIVFRHHRVIKSLLAFAAERQLIYIIGNHDHIPFVKYVDSKRRGQTLRKRCAFPGSDPIRLKYNDENLNLHAEHGNQYDIFNRYKDPRSAAKNLWGRTAAYICGLGERLIHPDFDEWTAKAFEKSRDEFNKAAALIKNKIPPSSTEYIKRGGDFSEYDNAAAGLISEGKKIVIFGHTHRAKSVKFDNGLYINCGAWCSSVKPTYVAISGEKAELRDGITHSVISKKG